MAVFLIEGVSGTGKTSVAEELEKRGYHAIDADEAFGFFPDPKTGLPAKKRSALDWIWDKEKFEKEMRKNKDGEILFISGGAMNQHDFAHYFSKIFTLQIDDETLKERLKNRTNNDYGKHPKELARQLEWNKGVAIWSRDRGTILIDATKPVGAVVDEILDRIK